MTPLVLALGPLLIHLQNHGTCQPNDVSWAPRYHDSLNPAESYQVEVHVELRVGNHSKSIFLFKDLLGHSHSARWTGESSVIAP